MPGDQNEDQQAKEAMARALKTREANTGSLNEPAKAQLSLREAQSLLRDVLRALDKDEVSEALEAMVKAAQGDRDLVVQLVMPFVNKVQAKVASQYGFEESTAGVVAYGRALGAHQGDPTIQQLLFQLRMRMMPDASQIQHTTGSRKSRAEQGLTLHDMEEGGAMCWSAPATAIKWSSGMSSTVSEVESVPGCRVVKGVLSEEECSQIIQLTEAMRFAPLEGLMGQGPRRNHGTQWWVGPKVADKLFERLRVALPPTVGTGQLCGLNLRVRVYKYNPENDEMIPHFDDGWEGNAVGGEEDHFAHWDHVAKMAVTPAEGSDDDKPALDADDDESAPAAKDDDDIKTTWSSKMSVLIYLNTVKQGGETNFYTVKPDFKPDPNASYEQNIKNAAVLQHSQQPEAGSALCYFHGQHELTALTSDEKVFDDQPKYVIRSDVIYKSLM